MKTSIILLRIAGIVCIFFTVFHCLFSRLFNWETTLSCLSQMDRAIMLTYHYICILIIGFMALVSIFQAKQITGNNMGTSILIFFSAFYLLRIVTEFTLFGFSGMHSVIIVILCLIPTVCFLIVLINNLKISR